ncbi:conjugal transfer protein MobC [Dyadobacter psychrotolerans]|uniref:Conjugal transfer protein TraG n=1 Tax=Dyadobacter psychrotolerans TaxID=2541721 RepID=A0A4R5DG08_9BACT|nr:conjugal transfer protein MobC [Dyadobacter psychrotolerans]TDE10734.1 conjugal transfer protein TraG [Dyadobacter psychrotolerans]
MASSDNQHALGKILDLTRMLSIFLLALHFYYFCYQVFYLWGYSSVFTDRILAQISKTGLFFGFGKSKLLALGLLIVSLFGAQGKKKENLSRAQTLALLVFGLLLYFLSAQVLSLCYDNELACLWYMALTTTGFLTVLAAGTLLSRLINLPFNNGDIFNRENESFPQNETLYQTEFSVNLPAEYELKGKIKSSWVNFIEPFRGILVMGSPGSGKSYFIIRHIITQHIAKGFSMFVYDFKYDDLSSIAYNAWLASKAASGKMPKFYAVNFDDLSRSHRCNPIEHSSMLDITDAAESARTILLGLNREWIKRQGDFFVESPINLLTAVFWFLRKYNGGSLCTLPHVIEFLQIEYDHLFTLLRTEKEIEILIDPFVSAYLNNAMEQLEGQIASAKIALARLSSPQLYYILSGNDFSLDINNPDDPKIVCMGNNPQKIQIYGAVLSLYVNRLVKLVNKKDKLKSSLIFDEFPTVYLNGIDSLIATARSNKVCTTIAVQDLSQLKKDYGREQADVIMNVMGNIISGQVSGESARQLSDRFGRIQQNRTSFSINRHDTSINRSKQLDAAIPVSKIAALSAGEFVGITADNPNQRMELKSFHCRILNDHKAIKKQQNAYKPLPIIRKVDDSVIYSNYLRIKEDIKDMVNLEIEKLLSDPMRHHLVIKKKK